MDPEQIKTTRVSRVDGNFNRIARDLDRAVTIARLQAVERYLWDRARELCWSFTTGEARPFRFNLAAESRLSGWDRAGLHHRLRALVTRDFFADAGDGLLLIQKDYRLWLGRDGTTPLFDDRQIAWCLAVSPRSAECGRQSTCEDGQSVDASPQSVDHSPQGCGPQSTGVWTTVHRGVDHSPQASRARESFSLRVREREETPHSPPLGRGGGGDVRSRTLGETEKPGRRPRLTARQRRQAEFEAGIWARFGPGGPEGPKLEEVNGHGDG